MKNLILNTDAYKLTHWQEYPSNLTKLYSYCEARVGGRFDEIVFFGLQMILQDDLTTKITTEMIDEAEKMAAQTFGTKTYFNRQVWEKVRDLGYLPIEIKALPEGLIVPAGTALFTIESTEDWFATTMNSLETLLMHIWYPTTIATNDLYIKRALKPIYEKTGTLENLPFAVNDFGLRGVTSQEAGERAGAAHLLHFRGTDNMAANRAIEQIYGANGRGMSVWATEHSVATSYGEGSGELDYLTAQLDRADDLTTISIVIDSFDDLNFIENVVGNPQMLERIKNRPGRIVFRPDSGHPIKTPLKILEALDKLFGHVKNDKGYKILQSNVGIIQGDGMKRETIVELYEKLTEKGWSADNLVVGSGGGLLQEGFDRDTLRFAIKASFAALSDGTEIAVQKKTKGKESKAGKLKVIFDEGYKTVSNLTEGEDLLQTVYKNGQIFPVKFDEIVARVEKGL